MAFLFNFIKSSFRMLVGACILFLAAAIPVYFGSVDKSAVVASGTGTPSPEDVARIYLDNAKISTALLIAESCADSSGIREEVAALFKNHPNWVAGGGDEPFFDAYFSTLSVGFGKNAPLYSTLSLSDNRKKLLQFLKQTQTGLVRKFIDLRSVNSTILPPVFTSAGAPLESALLTCALLAQAGDFNPEFQKDLAATVEKMKGDSAHREDFERFALAVLVLERDFDWTIVRSIIPHFDSLKSAYDFARVYKSAPDAASRGALVSALLICGDSDGCAAYLKNADAARWSDLKFACLNGEGALKFLLSHNLPVYKNSQAMRLIYPWSAPISDKLGGFVVRHESLALAIKILLALVGGYLLIRGFLRLFSTRRDTPAWYSPLALARGAFEAVLVATIFLSILEPTLFELAAEKPEQPELRFAIQKVINNIGEQSITMQTDVPTLVAIFGFLIIQFAVYVMCLIRISSIKRMNLAAKIKLKLLENEDNLFDLGLYIGLTGTVMSLILLSLGIFTASLMAGYTSTLFGIIFTAIVKIVHLRSFKRKLLIESSKEDQ